MSKQKRTPPLLFSNEAPQMGSTERSACLRINPNEGYAQIVFSDGKCSRKFISKETGLFLLLFAIRLGVITEEEVYTIEEQLSQSSLPERDSLIIDFIIVILNNSDEERDEGDKEEEDDEDEEDEGMFDLGFPPPPDVVRNN